MIENAICLAGGIVLGVLHHAYLQPKIAGIWSWAKAKAKQYGIGVRRDNG